MPEENEETSEDIQETTHSTLNTKPSIASRGVPAKETLYLPAYNSEELRSFQDKDENPTRNLWNADELVNFVFSKKYQGTYYAVASAFIQRLSKAGVMSGDETAEFVRTNSISKATFYNRVLPRLRRVGLIKIERDTIVAQESKRKFRPMRISISKSFGNYLMKIADSWLAIVDDVRSKAEKEKQLRL